ncbi:MAG: hypothetical protein EOO42_19260 [Flavobacteriales bacterium]|nr:MAG: hypothetical protein EOO42_19260 [Flavobacteriales bacterium]
MSIETKTLKNLETENTFVDIFTDFFNESYYGFIRQFNKDFLLLENYSDEGLYNGIIIFRRSDITRIKWDNNDIKSTQKLLNKHKDEKGISAIKIDSILNILKTINKTYKHVSIHIQNIDSGMCIIGEIKDMDKSTIIVHEFGTRASLDRGTIMFSVDEITRVDAGGIYENGILKIHSGKN